MDQTGDILPPLTLLALDAEDAAVCVDGFCPVPAPREDEAPHAD